ncbi:hypothetical protein BH11PLA2_BH11PLA2_36400 [soil metagenome]
MTLTTEELGDMPKVDATKLREVLSSEAFGEFAILAASKQEFIQAGNDWQPEMTWDNSESDPWVLEYRKGKQQFRAQGHFTLDQVQQSFQSYLAGTSEWHDGFVWSKLDL